MTTGVHDIDAAIRSRTISPIISAGVFWVAMALVISQSAERSSMVTERAALRCWVKKPVPLGPGVGGFLV